LANLVIHADYNESPCNLLIIKKEDYIYYSNSGMLRMPIEEVINGGNSLPRNITLQKLLRFIGFGESAGSGYDKILAPSRIEGYKIPELSEKESIRSTILKLWTKKVHNDSSVAIDINIDGLSKNQQIVLEVIRDNQGLNIPKIKQLCDLKPSSVEYAIKILRNKKVIMFVGESTKKGGYYLNDNTEQTPSKRRANAEQTPSKRRANAD
jgi:ATP-dependent DNA helicase RecG